MSNIVGQYGKKVLMIVENYSVPFDKRVWREAKALKDAGCKVRILCPRTPDNPEPYSVIDDIEIFRFPMYFSAGTALGYVLEYINFLILAMFYVFYIYIKKGFDVVHVSNPPDLLWIIALPFKLLGVRFIYDQHDLVPETFKSKFPDAQKSLIISILLLLEKVSYKLADAVIVTNKSYYSNALERGNIKSEKVFIVRNGPDLREFTPLPPKEDWKFGHKYLCAFIGVMGRQDGVDKIIEAARYIIKEIKRTDVGFILIGKGEEYERLIEMTQNLELSNHVKFTGRVDDSTAIEILCTADVCLAPDPPGPLNDLSTMNKVMEYMALGKPIVSFDLKETRFSAQEASIYAKGDDPTEFARGILYLLENSDLRKKMGEYGRKRVETELRWEKQIENLYRVYKHIGIC